MDPTRPVVVLAFGSAALGSPRAVAAAADHLVAALDEPGAVVGVLGAMGTTAADLEALAHRVSPQPSPRELDMLLAAGARISCALCAMAILDRGRRAVSLSGSQAGIVTDGRHGGAAVVDVRPWRLREELATGAVVLVAAGQGVSLGGEVTSVAHGVESCAVALARALGAARLETLGVAGNVPLPLERIA